MKDITENEMLFVLEIFKNSEIKYNANSIAKEIGVSSMGALKIGKRLENEGILNSVKMGKAKFYSLNLNKDYVKQYIKFLLKREAEQALPYIKRWISEIKKIKNAYSAVLFGSVLRKQKNYKDIDVLFITDKNKFLKLKKEIEEINKINIKKIHPLYQTKQDFKKNIKKRDAPVLSAIKGIVVFGEDTIINSIK